MKKLLISASLVYAAGACASIAGAQSADEASPGWDEAFGAQINDAWSAQQYRDFDFWIGEWEANWRPRPEGEFYHAEDGSWTRQRVFPVLGGKALVELAWARDNPDEPGQRGFSIRYFDEARERWVMAQNWPNGTSQGGAFTDQLIGDEHLGRLSMYSVSRRPDGEGGFDTQHRRYNFTDIRPGVSFRWDGSNTPDEGATWFTWYVVDFLRQRDLDPYGAAGSALPGVHEKTLCTQEPHGAFNALQGVWTGEATTADGDTGRARLAAGMALDGCGVIGALDANDVKTFFAIGYHPRFEKWVIFTLDDQPGTAHSYFVSDGAGEGATFVEAADLAIKDEFTTYNEPESYSPDAALRRIVWEAMTADDIAWRVETRESEGGAWRPETQYTLTRQ
ncbi:hypothetical protein [Hyphococcus sp.]|uniref:hypothetical protein n=1 Tax=Hyphococcus sp. TaxID=2038636 RepID=UPI003CCC30C8